MTNAFLNSSEAIAQHIIYPTITSLIGTLVGAVLGGLIAYYSGKKLVDRQQTKQAASAFIKAFSEELLRLKSEESIDTYKILAPSFEKHQKAIQEFMFNLPTPRQTELKNLWQAYYCQKETAAPFLEQYADNGSIDRRSEMRQKAKERLESMMSFAQKL